MTKYDYTPINILLDKKTKYQCGYLYKEGIYTYKILCLCWQNVSTPTCVDISDHNSILE